MRRFVAFPGIAVLLLLAVMASGWSVAPGSGGSSFAGPVTASGSQPDAWAGTTSVGTLGLRINAGTRSALDGSRDHATGPLGRGPAFGPASAGSGAAAAFGPGLPRRTPLPPFVTTLPPPADVRS